MWLMAQAIIRINVAIDVGANRRHRLIRWKPGRTAGQLLPHRDVRLLLSEFIQSMRHVVGKHLAVTQQSNRPDTPAANYSRINFGLNAIRSVVTHEARLVVAFAM